MIQEGSIEGRSHFKGHMCSVNVCTEELMQNKRCKFRVGRWGQPASTLDTCLRTTSANTSRHYGRVVKATDSNSANICFPLGAQVQILLVSSFFRLSSRFTQKRYQITTFTFPCDTMLLLLFTSPLRDKCYRGASFVSNMCRRHGQNLNLQPMRAILSHSQRH